MYFLQVSDAFVICEPSKCVKLLRNSGKWYHMYYVLYNHIFFFECIYKEIYKEKERKKKIRKK